MKRFILFLLLISLASLFSATWLPWNFPAVSFVIAAFVLPFNQAVWLAFIIGIINDLVWTSPLGSSSLIFLTLTGILETYARKYDRFHPLFVLIFSFISLVTASWFQLHQLLILPNLIFALLITLGRGVWQLNRDSQYAIRLGR